MGGVDGRHVGFLDEPTRIGGAAPGGREDQARELGGGHAHALLGQVPTHPVHALEIGDESLGLIELVLALGDARIVVIVRALRGWRRVVDLPGLRDAIGRIEHQELVEDGGAGARLARDEDRAPDRPPPDLGVPLVPIEDLHPVGEAAHQVLSHHHAADQAEPGLALEGVDQAVKGLDAPLVADVLQPGLPARLCDQRVDVEGDGLDSHAAEDGVGPIGQSRDEGELGRLHGISNRVPRLRTAPRRYGFGPVRIKPSWAEDAICVPSWVNIAPKIRPRAEWATGLSLT